MAIFSKKNSFEQESQKADKEAISSIIDARMVMKGELLFEGKTRIDGTVEGDIKGEHLILSEVGKVHGNIHVSTFVCHGTLEGNVTANLVTARKSCRIHGMIESNNLSVEPGAALSGEMKIATKELHVDEKNSTIPKKEDRPAQD
ncbi:MAG: polymer-forming cytoskeletal protein [Thermodesulfobacteriota bacterium]|nr:polymer-forming cytoskeletal protein [Thermodesulfobacteriota bacterium]